MLIFLPLIAFSQDVNKQGIVSIKAQFTDRFLLDNGYNSAIVGQAVPVATYEQRVSNFIRSRVGFEYFLKKKFYFRLDLQHVNFFGLYPPLFQVNKADNEMVYQAYGELYFNEFFTFKAGKMPLKFGNGRILGERDWLPYGLTHNVVMLSYSSAFDFSLGTTYDLHNPLKVKDSMHEDAIMQFLLLESHIGNMTVNFLALNIFLPEVEYLYIPSADLLEKVNFNFVNQQTIGAYVDIGTRPVIIEAEAYYQMGRNPSDWITVDSLAQAGMTLEEFNNSHGTELSAGSSLGRKINAYMYSLKVSYVQEKISISAGYDYLSGDSYLQNAIDRNNVINAFTPLWGDFHKFYGSMDYFYANSWTDKYASQAVGLKDFYIILSGKLGKLDVSIASHYFDKAGSGYFLQNAEYHKLTSLGLEADLTLRYPLLKDRAGVFVAFSGMKPTASLIALENADQGQGKNFFYAIWFGINFRSLVYQLVNKQ